MKSTSQRFKAMVLISCVGCQACSIQDERNLQLARQENTKVVLSATKNALCSYSLEEGHEARELNHLSPNYLKLASGNRNKNAPIDGWGNEIHYYQKSRTLVSPGPDGIFWNSDDIRMAVTRESAGINRLGNENEGVLQRIRSH